MFSFNRGKSRTAVDEMNSSSNSTENQHSHLKQSTSSSTITTTESAPTTVNVLLIGQIYQDTILYMNDYPKEDTKLRANDMQQRHGGNIYNTAAVLSQFPRLTPHVMSCLGSKEASSQLVSSLEDMGIKTKPCIYRKTPIPSSYIIQSANSGSRTIISCNKTTDLTQEEFIRKFEVANFSKTMAFSDRQAPYSWIHFEGRNISNVVEQIDWLESKASQEGWRSQLVISVELEKPDRPDIDLLLPKGDVVFFSKLFAQTRQYDNPRDFLRSIQSQCKSGATLFCTWGEGGATCLLGNGEILHASALPVHQVVDSVGAGDTFIAGIIFCLCRKLNMLTALKFACEMASRKVAMVGFDGLMDMMWKLWGASLDMANMGQGKLMSSKSAKAAPLVTEADQDSSRLSVSSNTPLL